MYNSKKIKIIIPLCVVIIMAFVSNVLAVVSQTDKFYVNDYSGVLAQEVEDYIIKELKSYKVQKLPYVYRRISPKRGILYGNFLYSFWWHICRNQWVLGQKPAQDKTFLQRSSKGRRRNSHRQCKHTCGGNF